MNQFAAATGDHQWIHVDPERAKSGPFGGTIAHGYLTMSLAPSLLAEVWRVDGMKMGLNYGINKLRFPSPVPVGSKLRVGAKLKITGLGPLFEGEYVVTETHIRFDAAQGLRTEFTCDRPAIGSR